MSHHEPTPPPPPLPEMNHTERKLWAAFHQLPTNMLLVSQSEMMEINRAIRTIDTEVKGWRSRMGFLLGTENVDEAGAAVLELRTLRRDALLKLEELLKQAEDDLITGTEPFREYIDHHLKP